MNDAEVTRAVTLTDFLLARIAEDERDARDCKEWSDCFACPTHETFDTARVLAECEAKRRIVERHNLIAAGQGETIELAFHEQGLFEALHFLALPYADHPDYREEWRP
jgi:hypothetical protein